MSSSPAIGDVTQTLRDVLVGKQSPTGLFEVSLGSPAEEKVQPNMTPRINLYLYRVLENESSKNRDWSAEGDGQLRYPPLSLTLQYVMTPFADNLVDEHRVLGEAMRVFYDFSVLEGSDLKGSLARSIEELRLDLSRNTLEELTRIWNAFNIAYRLSVCYQAHVVLIESTVTRAVTRVTRKVDRYELG